MGRIFKKKSNRLYSSVRRQLRRQWVQPSELVQQQIGVGMDGQPCTVRLKALNGLERDAAGTFQIPLLKVHVGPRRADQGLEQFLLFTDGPHPIRFQKFMGLEKQVSVPDAKGDVERILEIAVGNVGENAVVSFPSVPDIIGDVCRQ